MSAPFGHPVPPSPRPATPPEPLVGPHRAPATRPEPLFPSFFMGGFECSTHVLRSGRRLDLAHSTGHDRFAAADYRRLLDAGIRVARDGIRWHVIEPVRGRRDFSSARCMVQAALGTGIQVIWDLLHFGWPDHVDVFAPDFPERVADFAGAFARVLREEGDPAPAVIPVNEISFLSFAGGEEGFFNPFAHRRGDEMKFQLVRAGLAAGRAVREALPNVRLVYSDPIINVQPRPDRPRDEGPAAAHRAAQWHALDLLTGRASPELGGGPGCVDVIGVNYYVHNQWWYPGGHGSVISPSSPAYRPLHEMMGDAWRRYRIPIFIAETGIEADERPAWLAYVGAEARAALRAGVNLQGICLYPIVDHPGWEDDRHCPNGLWGYADDRGRRPEYEPLAEELRRQRIAMEEMSFAPEVVEDTSGVLAGLDAIARSIAEATDASREG